MPNVKPEDVRAYIISLIGKYEKQVEEVVKTSTRELSTKIKPELKGYSKKGKKVRNKKQWARWSTL